MLLGAVLAIVLKKDSTKEKGGGKRPRIRGKDRNSIIKEANRLLAENPKDPDALWALADLSFQEEDYENAFKYYKILIELCATVPSLNEFEITLRHAHSALKLKSYDEAYKSFMIARTLDENNIDVNYNLGYLEYMRKNYQRSAPYLQRAQNVNPEHAATNKYLGHSLYYIKKYQAAITSLRRALEHEPNDKNSLFVLAQSHFELGQQDYALKIFTHLRTDPVFGANAALYSGTIHLNTKQYQKAIMDFEIGLRHENLPQTVILELKYRLASASLNQGEITSALNLWNEIREIQPNYKDVQTQLAKYQEINTNRYLQVFLMAPSSEFVTLCRKIAANYFPKTATKLLDIALQKNEYVDILAEVHTRQWEDLIDFRFIRTSGQIGELMLRDLYVRIKEVKAGRGICLTTGTFSDTARSFVEARLIDLVEKKELLKLFDRLDSSL